MTRTFDFPGSPRRTTGLLTAFLAALLAAPSASADGLAFLAPERAPDAPLRVGLVEARAGQVAPAGDATVTAEGAAVSEEARQGAVRVFAVTPRQKKVVLRARSAKGTAEHTLTLGPPGARVRVSAEPAAPVKNQDSAAKLTIEVQKEDGTPDADAPLPVVVANVGRVEGLAAAGAGRFTAKYALPEAAYPEVAIVVAFFPWPHADAREGSFGKAIIPLASAVTLPGKTERNVQIAIEIAGKSFGPATSDESGRFELPIVVPPGHRFGNSIATDRAGNKRKKQLDLRLPPTDQLACVANPRALPLDGTSRSRLLCVATDPYGQPVKSARLVAKAPAGRLEGPRDLGEGTYEWELVAPENAKAGHIEVAFDFPAGGPDSKDRVDIGLLPGAMAKASVEAGPTPVFVGAEGAVVVRPVDALGRPVEARIAVAAERGKVGPFAREGGAYRATYTPPGDLGDGADRLRGELQAAPGTTPTAIAAEWAGEAVRARVTDQSGRPVPDLEVTDGETTAKTDADGVASFKRAANDPVSMVELAVAGRRGLKTRVWSLRAEGGVQSWPAVALPSPQRVDVSVELAPAPPVDVRVELNPTSVRYRVLDLKGAPLKERRVALKVVSADGQDVPTGPPHAETDGSVVVPLRGGVSAGAVAKVTDVATGVSAARELAIR